ncbi:heterokaryon incompatibility protein-domain-containing protein [Apiospora marii]|uniref:Heterokaryon incompatibility protein-domain-containing protein n=1 Tax=Apiospora marii TaxID=335849 RepID=A0ABR1RBW4_9PEZI
MERRSDQDFQQDETEALAPDTKTAITRSPAINWVEDCLANHPKCNILRGQKSWYPTRLLDFGDPEDPITHQCRLIETRTSAIRGPYMTLSHRWGPNPTDYLRLTSVNNRLLSNGIEVEMLPQLYRDAVYVVRQLRIRYIWIDSLCIIQQGDGHADLERELPQMSEIYSHSFCNISAAEALNDHHSLFHTRDPRSISPAMVSLPTSSHAGPFLVSYLGLWETDVSRSLINSRAWVLQERLLSPRVIHFGPQQLFWECCTKDAAEVYPDGMPPQIHSRRRRIKNLAPNCLVGVETTSDRKAAYMSWARIVEAYTACCLTCAGDKLVALSGIAKPFRSILEDRYVAGMWRRYLEHELLWVIANTGFGPDSPEAPEIPYRAPSWSWAAVDATVAAGDLDVRDSSILIHVEEVQLQHGSKDDTGHVRAGWLKLSGVLKLLVLLPRSSPTSSLSRSWEMVVNGTPVTRTLEDSSVPEEQAEVDLQVYLDRPRPTNHLQDPGEQNASEGLYCMPARVDDWSYGTIRILLLEVVDAEKGVFRRIGMAHAWGTGMKAKILGQGVYMNEDRFPCERYHDGRHTIVIV